MSEAVNYQGNILGNIHFSRDRKSYVMVFEKRADLERLLGLFPDDRINMSGANMTFSTFKERYLKKINVFYTSVESYLEKESDSLIPSRV